MKVVEVTARIISAAPANDVVFAGGIYNLFTAVVVEVQLEDGTRGYGEAIARRNGVATKDVVVELLRPAVLGRNGENLLGVWLELVDLMRRWGHARGIFFEALSGVDMALWDAVARARQMSIRTMLHGVGRSQVPCYASSVYIDEPIKMKQIAIKILKSGFNAIKIKIGRHRDIGGMKKDLEALEMIREAVGPEISLMVDANGAYDRTDAVKMARQLEGLQVDWFEEPVPPDDLDGYAFLRDHTNIPLAAGESEFAPSAFTQLINRNLIDVVQPDAARCGGITGMWQIAQLCYLHGVRFAPHTGFSGGLSALASLQVAASCPRIDMYEYMVIDNPLQRNVLQKLNINGGFIEVPQGPGLGVEPDSAILGLS